MMDMYALLMGGSGGGGGGSSLPSVTGADIGKSLMVGRKAAGTYTVVPEQSITVSEQFTPIPNADTTHWVAGGDATIVLDGVSYNAPVNEDGEAIAANFDVGAVGYIPDTGLLLVAAPGEHTIFVTVTTFTAEWNVDFPFMIVHETDGTLDRTYQDIMNAIIYKHKVVFIIDSDGATYLVSSFAEVEGQIYPLFLYAIGAYGATGEAGGNPGVQAYFCSTPDDYPVTYFT